MSYEKNVWAPRQVISSEKLNHIEDGIEGVYVDLDEFEEVQTCITSTMNEISATVGENKEAVAALNEKVDELNGAIQVNKDSISQVESDLTSRDQQLQRQLNAALALIDDLRRETAQEITIDTSNASVDKVEERVVLVTSGHNAQTTSVKAKAIFSDGLSIESGRVLLHAAESVDLKNVTTSGDLAKSVSNAAWSINTSGSVNFVSSVLEQTGYNAIEIGLDNTAAREINIKDVDFESKLSNNAILVFDTQDYAVVNIENCHFVDCSNAIRISNRSNVHVTVNIKNCTIDKWDSNNEFAGMVILEDYTSKSAEESKTADRFNADKVTINIINCNGPQGKITAPEDMSTIIGSQDQNQLIYVYNDKEGFVPYQDNEKRYPKIVIA